MKTKKLNNKSMNPAVYKLRRKVISLIHEANQLIKLPRLNVRVADNDDRILGVASMGGNTIWITEDMVASRAVVFHEILHAVYAQKHVAGCPLMNPSIDHNLPKDQCNQLFLKYCNARAS